jgi:predicted nucleic acid-binding protein
VFRLLPETPDIYPAWKALVHAAGVIGKQVHDARLVAVCHVYGIIHVLTFNVRHFNRFASIGPGILVVNPADVGTLPGASP